MIRILIVDDHRMVGHGFQEILRQQPDFLVVGAVETAEAALEWVRREAPEVVLMDLWLPGIDGFEGVRRLHAINPAVKCICLTAAEEPFFVRPFFNAGGCGYVTKRCGAAELAIAIREVVGGRTYIEPALGQRLSVDLTHERDAGCPFNRLSHRELEVITIDIAGSVDNDTALGARLGISRKTVSTIRHRALAKLGVGNLAEVIRLARRCGLLDSDRP